MLIIKIYILLLIEVFLYNLLFLINKIIYKNFKLKNLSKLIANEL